ncbi:MAG: hypothetical protein AAFQ82_18545 [Myxococcota bacterium]
MRHTFTFFHRAWLILAVVLVAPSAATAGSQLSAPFQVAKVSLSGKRVKLGRWKSSRAASASALTDVLVVAPWCVACSQSLERMRRNGRHQEMEMVVIPFSELRRAPRAQLEQYRGLRLYAVSDQSARGIRAYPSFFRCRKRGACRELSESERAELLR